MLAIFAIYNNKNLAIFAGSDDSDEESEERVIIKEKTVCTVMNN